MSFDPAKFDVSFDVSKKIVGDQSFENQATFTFTPGSKLQQMGGQIEIKPPVLVKSSRPPKQMFDVAKFECSSTSFVSILRQARSENLWKIEYSALTGAETDPIKIICIYWSNPIVPELSTGYYIVTKDYNG